jgi:hypothetical protein
LALKAEKRRLVPRPVGAEDDVAIGRRARAHLEDDLADDVGAAGRAETNEPVGPGASRGRLGANVHIASRVRALTRGDEDRATVTTAGPAISSRDEGIAAVSRRTTVASRQRE